MHCNFDSTYLLLNQHNFGYIEIFLPKKHTVVFFFILLLNHLVKLIKL